MRLGTLLHTFQAAAAVVLTAGGHAMAQMKDYPVRPVPFTEVHFTDGSFWSSRIETNRTTTIPFAFGQCEKTHRMYNFDRAAAALRGEAVKDQKQTEFPFDDTDPYKVIEGASYALAVKPDPELDAYIDKLIAQIAAAQEPDGYLYTTRTLSPQHPHVWAGKERWVLERELSHELYNLGHLFEAAAAHYQATGKRSLLDVALKAADLLDRTFGPNKAAIWPGHQITEMGLAKLYRVTGDVKYLDLAKFLLDVRGPDGKKGSNAPYNQSHLPPVQQREAVGHAVRAAYMYAGMADVAALTGDSSYLTAIDAIWDDVVGKKLYLTGGIGSTRHGEAFGPAYDLPNGTAYNETCAAIANVYWNQRLFLLHGDAKYIDVLERSLYNNVLSGVSLDGKAFFYPNPLASDGSHARSPWFGCACCPSNVSRFMASVPGYVYAQKDDGLYVNLFAAGKGKFSVGGENVELMQETNYPWDGRVKLTVSAAPTKAMTLRVRVPGWARGEVVPSDLYAYADDSKEAVTLSVNGQSVPVKPENGYVPLDRTWKAGDVVELNLPMPVRRVVANDKVVADHGRVALQRGPVVYCVEWPDTASKKVATQALADDTALAPRQRPDLLGGLTTIENADASFVAIPYYAWAHRGKGEMAVWLYRPQAAKADATTGEKTMTPAFQAWTPTPPMGWNSWNCYGTAVTEKQVKDNADYMAEHLLKYGWNLITVDIQWYEAGATGHEYRANVPLAMDENGRLLPAKNKFPSCEKGFKPLADYVHDKGLLFGVHLMRGVPRQAVKEKRPVLGTNVTCADIANTQSVCTWNPDMYGVDMSKPGAQEYYDSVFAQLAAAGVDFVKVDDLSRPYHDNEKEIEAIRAAIDKTGRPMVLSTSPGETPLSAAGHVGRHANLWRISDDFWDKWGLMKDQFTRLRNWSKSNYGSGYPDADMLALGAIRIGQNAPWTKFTQDEQVTHMTLWSIARSPLIFGGDLPKNDAWTLSLLTNADVIAVNQSGKNPREVTHDNGLVIWASDAKNGGTYVAAFNINDAKDANDSAGTPVRIDFQAAGGPARVRVRDLWTGEDLGVHKNTFTTPVRPHASKLYVLTKE